MFFLPSSFRICPSLKNDGTSGLHFGMVLTDFYLREEEYKMQAVPGHGEGVNRQVDERGKCEQKRKNKNKREQNQQKRF